MVVLEVVHLAGQGAVANIKEAPAAGMTHFLWLGCTNYHMVYPQGSLDQDLFNRLYLGNFRKGCT